MAAKKATKTSKGFGRRATFLTHDEEIALGQRGLCIRGYNLSGNFVARLDINSAGVDVYSGPRGRFIATLSWEQLIKRLS